MKEKYLVLWRTPNCDEPVQVTLDNLNQVRGALSAIDEIHGVLLFVNRFMVNE